MISAFGVEHGEVSKAFTGFLAAPKATRTDKLARMAAHEKKVTGNKPMGFSLKGQQSGMGMKTGTTASRNKKPYSDSVRTRRPGSMDYR